MDDRWTEVLDFLDRTERTDYPFLTLANQYGWADPPMPDGEIEIRSDVDSARIVNIAPDVTP